MVLDDEQGWRRCGWGEVVLVVCIAVVPVPLPINGVVVLVLLW